MLWYPAAKRKVHDAAVAEGDGDVRDVRVGPVREEQQVGGASREYVAARVIPGACLLPSVAGQRHAMQRKDALHETRAVRTPGRDAAPLVARADEPIDGGASNRVGRRRKAAPQIGVAKDLTGLEPVAGSEARA